MSAWRKAVALLVLLPVLAGCWSRRELNDLALVVSLGVDLVEEGVLEITVGVAGPGAAGGGKGQETAAITQRKAIISRQGRSFAEAFRDIELSLPRRLNMTHTLVVIVGERLAEHGLQTLLDYIMRSPEFRLQGMIMVLRGASIRELLETPPLMENLLTKALTEIASTRIGLSIRLWEYFSARATHYRSPMLPVIELGEHGSHEQGAPPKEVRLSGAAIMRGDKVVRYLNAQEVRAIKWLRGHGKGGVITVPCGEEPGIDTVSFAITQATHRTRASLTGDQPRYQIALRGKLRVSEMQCHRPLWTEEVQEQLIRRAEKELHELVTGVIAMLQESETDPLYFGERIRAYHPAVWHRVGHMNWGRTWSESKVDVTVDLHLQSTGLMGDPHTFGRPHLAR